MKLKKMLMLFSLLLALSFTFSACEMGKSNANGEQKQGGESEFKDAASHITYANFNTFTLKNMGFDAKMTIKGDYKKMFGSVLSGEENQKYVNFLDDFLNNATVKYNLYYKYDEENKVPKLNLSYGLLLKDRDLVDILITTGKDKLGFSLPSISNKGVSITYQELIKDSGENEIQMMKAILSLDYVKYVNIILGDKKAYDFYSEDLANYKAIYDKYLNESFVKTDTQNVERDGKTIAVTEYKGSYDLKKNMELQRALLNEAKEDKKLQQLIIDKALLVTEEFLNSKDYEAFGYSEELVKKTRDELAAADINDPRFQADWKHGIEQGLADLDRQQSQDPNVMKLFENTVVETVVRINEENKLDSYLMHLVINDPSLNGELAFDIEMVTKQVNDSDFADLEKFFTIDDLSAMSEADMLPYLSENKEMIRYMKEYGLEIINYFLDGENVKPLYEMMEQHKLTLEKSMIEMYLTQTKIELENMDIDAIPDASGN